MHLDVIIPTYNRSDLLTRTLESLVQARVPDGLSVAVTVVDNNSRDATPDTVASFVPRCPWPLHYVFESAPGRSHALNAGIRATRGDLVGMIDDDEEVDAGWFEEIARAFADPSIDYIGGPYVPRWEAEPPAWLPKRPSAVIGWVDGGPTVQAYGSEYQGVLMGGNAVIRREQLLKAGLYDPSFGRTSDGRLLSCEDDDMHRRLMARGARGEYRPGLIIHHFIPLTRMTVDYHQRWFFWHAVSLGLRDRTAPEPVPYVLGIPRYLLGEAVRGLATLALGIVGLRRARRPHEAFDARMALWRTAGFWYGKHRFRASTEAVRRAELQTVTTGAVAQ